MPSLQDLRRDYTLRGLRKADLHADPFQQFQQWLDQAISADLPDANAMSLSTVAPDGTPSSRIVLLKEVTTDGFLFFTNYDSPKGRDLAKNPRCSLLFFWAPLERQIRIAGTTTRVAREKSETYFHSRPRESQLGAYVSRQGETISSRAELERLLVEAEERFRGKEIPLPEFWGGYCVAPEKIEFWQGRAGRLHDRLRYSRNHDRWTIERLSP